MTVEFNVCYVNIRITSVWGVDDDGIFIFACLNGWKVIWVVECGSF